MKIIISNSNMYKIHKMIKYKINKKLLAMLVNYEGKKYFLW